MHQLDFTKGVNASISLLCEAVKGLLPPQSLNGGIIIINSLSPPSLHPSAAIAI